MPHDQEMVRRCMEASIQLKLFLDDNRDISRIANKIIQWKKEGVRVILADFLTAFTVPEDMAKYMNPRQQVNYILSTFVFLSKELGIPIILYAQLNRQNLQRKNGEPNLGDLKESGSIEEFAFQVSFLHRPEYYDPNASEDEWGEDVKGLMYQIIAKHRDGILDRIKYKAQLNLSKLYDWENSIQDKVPQWNPEAPAPFDGKRAASNDVFQGAIEFDKDDEPF
jgi:replicative DNA helicase